MSAAKPNSEKTGSKASLVDSYTDCKSKVQISGEESRVELMGKVLEMDEEIGLLLKELRLKDSELKTLKSKLATVQDDSQRKEDGLITELDMLTHKNSVMSNLYETVIDHADALEEELERRISLVIDDDTQVKPGDSQKH